jgi:hypothetical protein
MSDSEPSDNSLSRSPAPSRSLSLVLRNLLFTDGPETELTAVGAQGRAGTFSVVRECLLRCL